MKAFFSVSNPAIRSKAQNGEYLPVTPLTTLQVVIGKLSEISWWPDPSVEARD